MEHFLRIDAFNILDIGGDGEVAIKRKEKNRKTKSNENL